MQALGLLPKQSWRPYSHLFDSGSFTARALSSITFKATLHSRTISHLSCISLKQCPHSRLRPAFAWRRGGRPMSLPSRFASNFRKVTPYSGKEGGNSGDVRDQLLEPSGASLPPEANPPSVAIDPVSGTSRDEPTNPKQSVDDDLVHVVHLRRNTLVIWSFIAIFVTVYTLGLPLRDGSNLQDASGPARQRLLEAPADGETFASAMQPTVPALAVEKLAYQVKNWPPSPNLASWSPFVTSMFAHGSLMHLGFNCYGFYQLSSYLMCTPIGISGTLAVWFFGGLAATQVSCYSQKSYATGNYARAKWYSKLFKKDPVDPNPGRTLNAFNLGASGGLMSLMAVVAVWRGGSLWGLPLINVPIPARFIGLLTLAWDFYGNYNNSSDGIGHNAHLCGMAVGAGIALVGLTRGKYSKTWTIVAKR